VQRSCKALTKKAKPCHIIVEPWRDESLCHVHDPNGTFRLQQSRKGYKNYTVMKSCQHKWYMKPQGIQCKECLVIWESDDVS
jgi:recombinational DNA repair protein RecR